MLVVVDVALGVSTICGDSPVDVAAAKGGTGVGEDKGEAGACAASSAVDGVEEEEEGARKLFARVTRALAAMAAAAVVVEKSTDMVIINEMKLGRK